ncbi:RNA polymerase sigma factor [Litorimonas sp.]|uniref:RNA polymerase sigma factor n=1 Tax=Litorimonas sp. TaxID=1892381 RepID=UPI003A847155
MPKAKTKADLVKALDTYQAFLASKGDRNAFEGLYKRWHPKGIRLAQRLTGNAEEAKDVLQEASMTIARNIHRLEKPEQFSAWAYTIVRRRAADHIRSTIKAREASVRAARYQESPPQSCAETDLSLRQVLSHLPSEERALLTLFYVDGFTGRDIAQALGIPLGTVKSRLFKARENLKQYYQPVPRDDTPQGERNE